MALQSSLTAVLMTTSIVWTETISLINIHPIILLFLKHECNHMCINVFECTLWIFNKILQNFHKNILNPRIVNAGRTHHCIIMIVWLFRTIDDRCEVWWDHLLTNSFIVSLVILKASQPSFSERSTAPCLL